MIKLKATQLFCIVCTKNCLHEHRLCFDRLIILNIFSSICIVNWTYLTQSIIKTSNEIMFRKSTSLISCNVLYLQDSTLKEWNSGLYYVIHCLNFWGIGLSKNCIDVMYQIWKSRILFRFIKKNKQFLTIYIYLFKWKRFMKYNVVLVFS